MGTDPRAEFLTRMASREKLISASKKLIEHTNILVQQSRRLIGIAMGHEGNNASRMRLIDLKPAFDHFQRCTRQWTVRKIESASLSQSGFVQSSPSAPQLTCPHG
jgi:hypothetical protein